MRLEIVPVARPLDATVRVPGSKSATNRALVLAALADGPTTLEGAVFCDDSVVLAESLARLGFTLDLGDFHSSGRVVVAGRAGSIPAAKADLHVGNAGTAARFLTALVALGDGCYTVDGVPRMRERPIADLAAALEAIGAQVETTRGCPPVTVRARGLAGGSVAIPGSVSSQFVSALLMVGPYTRKGLAVEVTGALSSRPYVDLTVSIMKDFGVTVERETETRFTVPRGCYRATASYQIEPDASSASYVFGAAAIVGGQATVRGLGASCRQGDVRFVKLLEAMGCDTRVADDGMSVRGRGELRGIDADMRDIPDVAPTLAAIAPFAASATTIRGIESARLKECDRVSALCAELRRVGVNVEEHPDGLTIQPCRKWKPAVIRTYDDHRIAMAFALIGLRVPGIVIDEPACVSKTFPGYFDMLAGLGT